MPLTLSVPDSKTLYEHYMSFVKEGGFFLPTTGDFEMGQVVDVVVDCAFANEKVLFSGSIIWLSPDTSTNGAGIGVQMTGNEGEQARAAIEKLIAAELKENGPTRTL